MNSVKILFLICILCITPLSRGDIYKTDSVEEISNKLTEHLEKRNPQKTLTILPLEGFLLRSVHPAFHVTDKKFTSAISKITEKAKLSKQAYIQELILTEYEQKLSDPKIIEFFKNIQEYNAPFIIVTSNVSGSFNKIPYLEVWTWNYLVEQGINLSKNPIGSKQIIFNKRHKKINQTYPTFYRGLLSCNSSEQNNSIHNLIASLLIWNLKWIPDIVYVVDKDENYIKSIEQQFKSIRNDIQVIGFVYAPVIDKSDQISTEQFFKFWTAVVNKLNSIQLVVLKKKELKIHMNNKLQFVLCLVIISFTQVVSAKFVTTYSVNSPIMQEIAKWADQDTIIFIDLDDTLVIPKSNMFLHNSNPHRMFISNMVSLAEKTPHYNSIIAKWYQQRKVKLVETMWTEYIKNLQRKGASVYGVCTMPLHLINIEKKRYLEAKGLNIIFTNKINDKETLKIQQERQWFSFFYKGIIFTGPYSASHTLVEFFKNINMVPKKMVFISNIQHELERIEKRLRIFDMEFYNVLYLGVKNLKGKPDDKIVKLQQQELIQNGRWLEDDAAKILLDKISSGKNRYPIK